MRLSDRPCTVALLLGAAGCSSGDDAPAPTVSVERTAAGNGDFISIESDTLVDGRRPRLILVCEDGMPATFHLDLVRPPASPPPLRGVFAQIQAKGGPEVTIELGWVTNATWVARRPHPSQADSAFDDRENQRRMVPVLHAFGKQRELTITPPAAHGPGERLVWSPQTYAPQLAAVQDCTALDGSA